MQDVYSYGFLVPVISLVWVRHEKEKLRRLPIQPSLISGVIVLLTGGVMLVLGQVSSAAIVQELAVIVIIPGLVSLLLGKRFLLALALPLAYLVLMVPILDGVVDRLHLPFQLFSAAIAERLLNAVHIPVFRTGQCLELPNITLEVANACSGVRYLISTIALCIPLAFITQKNWMPRALLFFFAILLSLVANPLRVALVGMWAHYGKGDIHGPFHMFQGYFVYVVGMILLFTGAWTLHAIPLLNKKQFPKRERMPPEDVGDLHKFHQAWLLSLILLLGLGASVHLFKSEPVPLKKSLDELPLTIGEWKDAGRRSDVRPLSIPGADFELARAYRNASGKEVKLQIAYFESQRRDKKLVYYQLQALYENSGKITMTTASRRLVRVNKSMLRSGARDSLILSWYDLNGRIIANRYMATLITAYNGIVHRRTNGAVIFVSNSAPPGGMDMASGDEIAFVQRLLPLLDNFIP